MGSSRNSTSGSSAQARASARRCCSPPESTRAGRSRDRASPTRSSAAARAAARSRAARRQREREAQVAERRRAEQHRRWNTIAWRRGARGARLPSGRCPVGASSPCSVRSSTLLPGAVGAEHDAMRSGVDARGRPSSRPDAAAAANETPASRDQRRAARPAITAPCALRRSDQARDALSASTIASSTMPRRERERQVALGRLERDRGGHHARDAVDVAADDHHRADLGDRAAERGEQHGRDRAALVQQRSSARGDRRRAHRAELLAAVAQRIGDDLARQRGDDRNTSTVCAMTIAVGVNRMPNGRAGRCATAAGRRPGRRPPRQREQGGPAR